MCYVYYKKYHRNNFSCVHSVWPWCVLGYVTIMYWVCHHNIRLVSSWYNNCWSITRLLSTPNKNVIRLTFLSEEWTEIANNQKIPVYDFDLFKSTCNFQHDQKKIITYYLPCLFINTWFICSTIFWWTVLIYFTKSSHFWLKNRG